MERFTEKDERGYYIAGDTIYGDGGDPEKFRGDAIDRLARYEDLEEQGRLLELPCGVGDIIYRCGDPIKKIYEWLIEHIEIYFDEIVFIDDSDNTFTADEIGKTVFLTRAEAEAALAASGKEG